MAGVTWTSARGIEPHMTEALLSIHVEALPEGGFLATSDELPGLLAQGRTVAETL